MILVDAVYINKSGGKVLLEYLINYILNRKLENDYYFLLDKRISLSDVCNLDKLNFNTISHSEKNRKIYYLENKINFNSFFCLANVPPPIAIIDKPVTIFFQNTLIVGESKINLNVLQILFFLLKKLYIKYKNKNNYKWIVQSKFVAELINSKLSIKKEMITILPFFENNAFKNINLVIKRNPVNYLYVADSSPQKNHFILLRAWKLFSLKFNNKVTLHLTLPNSSSKKVLALVYELQKEGCNIINHQYCTKLEIEKLYNECYYFIFPSLTESFGLPLIEAANAGCKIISSDLPYVYEVVQPSIVFDPHNIDSLIDALTLSINYEEICSTKLIVKNKIEDLLKNISYVQK